MEEQTLTLGEIEEAIPDDLDPQVMLTTYSAYCTDIEQALLACFVYCADVLADNPPELAWRVKVLADVAREVIP
jgi:hypothetical protein